MRDALIISVPVLLLLFYVLVASVLDFQRYRLFDDYWSRAADVNRFFEARMGAASHVIQALRTEHQLDQDSPDAGIIRITVPAATWDSMNGDPMAAWGIWFSADLVRENSLTQIDLRRRGDNSVHWLTPKQSFTMKTPETSLFKGFGTMGLSAKEVLPAFVANRLVHDLGLFAPTTEVTPVFVNNRFYGIFRFNEVVDEDFLRDQFRLPGNVFRGDAAERGEYFKGTNRNLFQNAYIWGLAARSQRPNASPILGLQALLTGSNATTLEEHRRLLALVDRVQVVRMAAVMLVLGDPWHLDGVHNQFWYEDPWSMLLTPIPWDIRVMDLTKPASPGRVNPFYQEVMRNPFLIDEVLRQVRQVLEEEHGVERAEQLARTTYDRYRPYFEYDRLRAGLIPDVGDPATISRVLKGNRQVLRNWMDDAKVAFHAQAVGRSVMLDFEARGYAGNDLTALTLSGGQGTMDGGRVYADRNLNGILDPADPMVAGRWSGEQDSARFILDRPEPIYAAWETRQVGILPGVQQYRFFLVPPAGLPAGGSVTPVLRNRITGAPTSAVELENGKALRPAHAWHAWEFPVINGTTHRLSGQVRLTHTLEIAASDTLLVEPGTTVRLDPDVSILVRGHFEARGDSSRPITFMQAVAGLPWGTIALQGESADSSIISWTRFYGGGGAILHEVEYTGAVSLHYVKGVRYDHFEVAHNVRSDDAFHAYHATFTMRNCRFIETNADAIDLDFAEGEISHCRFEHAGNDAMDLMTSDPYIHDNYIEGSDDKGVSVGESSNPVIFNNYITGCERGIEVKDGSEPLILNNTLVKNNVGIRQRLKNVRYWHGGWGKVINTLVTGNKTDLESDHASRVSVWGSVIGTDTFPSGDRDFTDWLYRAHGIRPDTVHAGVLASWTPDTVRPPLVAASFEDDFGAYSDGWVASGSADHLQKRNRNLTVSLRNWSGGLSQRSGDGMISRAVDWDLTGATGNSLVVFELTGRDIVGGRITLSSEQGSVSVAFKPNDDFLTYRYVTLSLPPGRYTSIRIEAKPLQGLHKVDPSTGLVDVEGARLEIHSYVLYSSLDRLPSAGSPPVVVNVTSR